MVSLEDSKGLYSQEETDNVIACGYTDPKFLAEGAFGKVYRVVDPKTNKYYAMKQFTQKRPEGLDPSVIRELNMLASLKHPNIINPHELTINKCDVCCILNFMDGNLYTYMEDLVAKKTNRKHTINIFSQIVAGVHFLHENKIIHGDLKPENVLLKYEADKVLAKITDLDCIISPENDTKVDRPIGTVIYTAPELIPNYMRFAMGRESYNGYYSNMIDIWSLGYIFYMLYTERPLYNVFNYQELADSIVRHKRNVAFNVNTVYKHIPFLYVPLIKAMLDLNPEKRPTTGQILHFLKYPPVPGKCYFLHKPLKSRLEIPETTLESVKEWILNYSSIYLMDKSNEDNIHKNTFNLLDRCLENPSEIYPICTVCYILSCKLFRAEVDIEVLLKYMKLFGNQPDFEISNIIKLECSILHKLKFRIYIEVKDDIRSSVAGTDRDIQNEII